jgi:cysteine desulfurase
LGVDLYTVSAHKIYAPRGIAALWVKSGVVIDAMLVGGGQEDGFRSSTENVAGAAAFAYSAKKMIDSMEENNAKDGEIKRNLLSKLENSGIKDYFVCNSNDECLPYILSLSFDKIKGEVLMYALESDGILISTGSACSSKKAGNRTLQAMGKTDTEIIGSVRISFSPYEEYDVEYIADSIIKNVLRFEKNVMVKK